MKMIRVTAALLILLLLAGCPGEPEATLAPETTVPSTAPVVTTVPETTAETTIPVTTVPETTEAPTEPPETTEAPTEPPETTVLEGTLRQGYYVLTAGSENGKTWTKAQVEEQQIYVWIRPGHIGTMSMDGWNYHLDWTNRFLLVDGMNWAYTLEGDTLTVDYNYTQTLVLTYCGEELPEGYESCALQPGMYIVYARWDSYYETYEKFPSYQVENGILDLKEDHTGVMIYRGERWSIRWDEGHIMCSSTAMDYGILERDPIRLLVSYSTEALYLERLPNPIPYE